MDSGWGHIAIAAMIGLSVVEIFLYFEIVRMAGPIFVSQANFVTVVTGVFWGMVIFGERPGEWLWLSVAMLFIALYFVATESKSRTPAS
jgi:drug/metabolite transporter (DMT)-like permease